MVSVVAGRLPQTSQIQAERCRSASRTITRPIPFSEELIDCFKTSLEEHNTGELEVTAMVREAAGSEKTQNEQVRELIDAGCNVLCVNLVDRADPSEIIDMARESDIPLIFFNREPVEKICCSGSRRTMWALRQDSPDRCRASWRRM